VKIVHVTDCYLPRLGGIELQVHDLATRQAVAGHDVTIVTTTAGVASPSRPALEVVRAAKPGHPAERIMYRSTRAAIRGLTPELGRFDLVHVHASSFSPLSFLAAHHASGRGVPSVATVHSLWAKATPLFRAADLLTGWGDWQVVWSAVSNAAAASLRGILGGRAPVTILPNGIDPEEWNLARDAGAPSLVGPGPAGPDGLPGALRVAAVSRLARRKRILQLVEILQAAHDRLPPGVVLDVNVLGEGPQRKEIERYLRRHDMEGWVHLLGRRSRAEIRHVFARSDLFVAPARLESFGIAALEGRCAGLPVVARAGTGVEDFVADGVEGWLVRSDADMVDAIVRLARRPETLARVAEHNQTVPARISWKVVLDECEDLYERAAGHQGRPWHRAGSGPMVRAPALRGSSPPRPDLGP
jgi:glycosyltransferase involved in cell wall biosynthesis